MTPQWRRRMTFFLIYAAIPLCWSSTFLGTQLAMRAFTPLWLGAVRYIGASAVYLAVLLASRPLRAIVQDARREWLGMILIGASGIWLAIAFQNLGLRYTTSSHAALLSIAEPMLTVLFAVLFLRERLRRGAWLGMAVALAGALLIATEGRLPGRDTWAGAMRGNLMILGSLTAYAAYTIFSKRVLRHVAALTVVTISGLWGTAFLTITAGLLEPLPRLADIPPAGWTALLYLVLFPTCLTYFLYNWLLQQVLATRLTVVLFLIPVYGVVLGALVMGDRPPLLVYAGGLIAILGVMAMEHAMAPGRPPGGGLSGASSN